MSKELLAAAEVLEKVAAYIEAVEAERETAASKARDKVASELKARFSEATGEVLSDELVNKLATAEPDVLSIVEKLAGSSQAPVSLGGPSENTDGNSAPLTKKEAAVAAEDRFAAWLNS